MSTFFLYYLDMGLLQIIYHWLLATLVPINQNKRKWLNNNSNYITNALGSIFSNILFIYNILTKKQSSIFTSSGLQFGWKAKHSTRHWSFVVEEVIDFYNINYSPFYLVNRYVSRAFDLVGYNKLFRLLIDRNRCPLYARLLISMFTRVKLKVRLNGKCNGLFSICNGVKQGGILRPILFVLILVYL